MTAEQSAQSRLFDVEAAAAPSRYAERGFLAMREDLALAEFAKAEVGRLKQWGSDFFRTWFDGNTLAVIEANGKAERGGDLILPSPEGRSRLLDATLSLAVHEGGKIIYTWKKAPRQSGDIGWVAVEMSGAEVAGIAVSNKVGNKGSRFITAFVFGPSRAEAVATIRQVSGINAYCECPQELKGIVGHQEVEIVIEGSLIMGTARLVLKDPLAVPGLIRFGDHELPSATHSAIALEAALKFIKDRKVYLPKETAQEVEADPANPPG